MLCLGSQSDIDITAESGMDSSMPIRQLEEMNLQWVCKLVETGHSRGLTACTFFQQLHPPPQQSSSL